MTYNRKGELVEIDKVTSDKKTENKPVKLVEKSNIFKTSAFVTDSKFKGNKSDFKSGLVTKKNFTLSRVPPSRGNLVTKNHPHPTKASTTIHRSTTFPPTDSATTTTPMPPPFTAIIFSDDFSSTENSLHNTYDDIKSDFQQYSPVTQRPQSIESTIFVYSTPSPTTLSSIIVKKTKKKKKNKKVTTTPIPIHEHIIQNLDYYRKLLGLNCTKTEVEKQAEQLVVSITPKPSINIKMSGDSVKTVHIEDSSYNNSSEEGKDDKKKKKKKHCKKKHGHHSSHLHGHHHHKVNFSVA